MKELYGSNRLKFPTDEGETTLLLRFQVYIRFIVVCLNDSLQERRWIFRVELLPGLGSDPHEVGKGETGANPDEGAVSGRW